MAIAAKIEGKLMDLYSKKDDKSGNTTFKAVLYQSATRQSVNIGITPDTFTGYSEYLGEDVSLDCSIGQFTNAKGQTFQFIKEIS